MKVPDVLVLNKAWIPIHIVAWKKAMSLIYQDHAHSLDRDYIAYDFQNWLEFSTMNAETYPKVHSVSLGIAIPEIIVLRKYDKLPDRDVKFSRENVYHRDKYTCCYCGKKFPVKLLSIDHIKPKCKGGKSTWDNIATACKPCNNLKDNKTPEEAHMKLLKKPHQPHWLNPINHSRGKEHICLSWRKFMDRVDVEIIEAQEQNEQIQNGR